MKKAQFNDHFERKSPKKASSGWSKMTSCSGDYWYSWNSMNAMEWPQV